MIHALTIVGLLVLTAAVLYLRRELRRISRRQATFPEQGRDALADRVDELERANRRRDLHDLTK